MQESNGRSILVNTEGMHARIDWGGLRQEHSSWKLDGESEAIAIILHIQRFRKY